MLSNLNFVCLKHVTLMKKNHPNLDLLRLVSNLIQREEPTGAKLVNVFGL